VDAIAIDEAAVEHRNFCFGKGEKLPIEVDDHRELSEEELCARRAAPSARGPLGGGERSSLRGDRARRPAPSARGPLGGGERSSLRDLISGTTIARCPTRARRCWPPAPPSGRQAETPPSIYPRARPSQCPRAGLVSP